MPDLIERTALAEFTLYGKPVRAGQVVPIDRLQLARLVKAGCVAETDEENAAVAKAGLPETQWGSGVDFQKDIDEAAALAAEQIAAHRQSVEDARETAEREIAGHVDRERQAFEAANNAVREHDARADQARKDADDAIDEHRKRVAEATRETGSGNGAGTEETPPASGKGGNKPKG